MTLHESNAIIAVADDFTRNQIEGRLRTRLEDALSEAFQARIRIAVMVDPELQRTADLTPPQQPAVDDSVEDDTSTDRFADLSTNRPVDLSTLAEDIPAQPAATQPGESRLNPKYTFDTFVIGSTNR